MRRPTRASADGRAYLDLQNLARRQHRPTQQLLVLQPLSAALGDLANARARTYETYRRRLGQDSPALPEKFHTLIDDVTAFTDPLLLNITDARHWKAHSRTWTT